MLWRCPLWPARAIAATPGTARTQQPGRATPRQSGRTVRHRPGRAALAERSLPQGTAHPRAGCGAAWAAAGTRIAGSRTTESNFVPCWAACRVAAHGSWVRRGRREKGRKKHLFSLTVLGAQREGEEGLDKDLILDCLISVRLLLNQRLPRYSLSWVPPSTQLPRGGQGGERAQLGQHRQGHFRQHKLPAASRARGSHTHQLIMTVCPPSLQTALRCFSPAGQRCLWALHVPPQSQRGPAITW